MDKKEIEKAIEKTVLKMALEPNNTEHYHELAKYYAMNNQYEQVISVYESLLEIDPKDMQTLLNLGSIWFYSAKPLRQKPTLLSFQRFPVSLFQ